MEIFSKGYGRIRNKEGCQPPACGIWHENICASYKIWSSIFKTESLPDVFSAPREAILTSSRMTLQISELLSVFLSMTEIPSFTWI